MLLTEVLEQLHIQPSRLYVDGTYGRGGHARAILERLGPEGRLWVADWDPQACAHAQRTLGTDARVHVVQDSFAQLPQHLRAAGLQGEVAGVLLDVGLSSAQLDAPERGFSFQQDGPLDMRMSGQGRTAAQWLAQAPEKEIADVLWRWGEERHARRIARAIVTARTENPLTRTRELAQVISQAMPSQPARLHPATRSFQAIRIHVNRELEQLEQALQQFWEMLSAEARLVVISFHSLEDRIVKQFMRQHSTAPSVSRHRPAPAFTPTLEAYPLQRPTPEEIERNPRARSARLRSARRLPCAT